MCFNNIDRKNQQSLFYLMLEMEERGDFTFDLQFNHFRDKRR